MNPYRAARDTLTAALVALDVPVHAYEPGSVQPPAVVIQPSPTWKSSRGHVTLDVVCIASGVDHTAAQQRLEQLLWDAEVALSLAGFGWQEVGAPTIEPTGQTVRGILTVTLRP
jgi:hypothetical protein